MNCLHAIYQTVKTSCTSLLFLMFCCFKAAHLHTIWSMKLKQRLVISGQIIFQEGFFNFVIALETASV